MNKQTKNVKNLAYNAVIATSHTHLYLHFTFLFHVPRFVNTLFVSVTNGYFVSRIGAHASLF